MKLSILDINKIVKDRDLKEVKNPIYFNLRNTPTEDGLFSYEIFGQIGSDKRKFQYAYIDLKGKFIHPLLYKLITSLGTKYAELITGNKYYRVVNGDIVEDSENGRTGLDFFYEIYDNLKFKESDSRKRSEKLVLLSTLNKNDVFIDKFLVIPAFYRDFNPNKSGNGTADLSNPINDKYVKIIRSAQALDNNSFAFVNNTTKNTIQNTLLEIYEMLTSEMAGKSGLIHKSLIGKNVDYATRSVISAPRIKSKKWNELAIRFGYTGIPLSQVAVLFLPFFVKWITDFVDQYEDELSVVEDVAGNEIKINNIKSQFTENDIKKMINNYVKNIDGRFSSLMVKDNKGKSYPVRIFREDLKRNFTLIDLLYLAADDIVKDKHVYITRYPVENALNIFPSKIKILTTNRVTEMKIMDKYLKDYPIVHPDHPSEDAIFIDSTWMHNSYLKALGGEKNLSKLPHIRKNVSKPHELLVNS